jgi:hypothetical protein
MTKPPGDGGKEKIRTTKNRNWQKDQRAKARCRRRREKRARLRAARREKDNPDG